MWPDAKPCTAARSVDQPGPRRLLRRHSAVRFIEGRDMTTILDKELKRQISVKGTDYTVILNPEGMRLVGKGKRRPEVQLRWSDLLNGEAALAVALNASLLAAPVLRKPTRPARSEKDATPTSKKRR